MTTYQLGCSFALSASAAAALLLTPAVRAVALRLGVVDHSDGQRKLHHRPVPLLGGVAVWLSMLLGGGLAAAYSGSAEVIVPLAMSGGLVCAVGVVDDVWTLQPRWKLLGQVVATWPVVVSGLTVPAISIFGLEAGLGWWSEPFTVVWLVAGINAFNFIDGIDGLAATIGLTATAALAAIVLAAGNGESLPLLLAVCGALSGFLVYNVPPARIYLGDAGSMLIGLTISTLAILSVRTGTGAVASAPLLLLMSVPLSDMALAVGRRVQTGVFFWRADRLHVHHRLLERGFGPRSALAFIALLHVIMVGLGIAALLTGAEAWCAAAAVAVGVVMIQARLFGHHEWGLLKRTLATALLSVTAQWSVRRFRGTLPSLAELRACSTEESWQQLVRALGKLTPTRLDVTVGSGTKIHWRRELAPENKMDGALESCVLHYRSESPEAGWCLVRIHVGQAERMSPAYWLSLVAAVEHFCRHWAASLKSSPVVVMPEPTFQRPAA